MIAPPPQQQMPSTRRTRRLGIVLFVCGLILTGIMGTVLYFTVPLLLRPGVDIGGTRFNGSPEQGRFFLRIMSAVLVFGVTAMVYGVWQMKTGRQNIWMKGFLIGLAALLMLVAMWM